MNHQMSSYTMQITNRHQHNNVLTHVDEEVPTQREEVVQAPKLGHHLPHKAHVAAGRRPQAVQDVDSSVEGEPEELQTEP